MKGIKISIITPSYNQGKFLEQTIHSVLNQNYLNLEYIIIDGGSTDNSVEIIKKYKDQLAYWVSEPDQGTWEANNKGLQKIRGDYWCILNSDDLLLPGALTRVTDTIEHYPEAMWITGGEQLINSTSRTIGERMPVAPEKIAGLSFLNGCWIPHQSTFLHKSVLDKVGLFRPWHTMDYDYWLRMEHAGYTPMVINDCLGAFRIHEHSKTQQKISLFEDINKVFHAFVVENDLLSNKEVKAKMLQQKKHLARMVIAESLNNEEYLRALKALLFKSFELPGFLLDRWYYGNWMKLIKYTFFRSS